ncbi:unnamed protein product, partial [Mesorhabditis spiculigera]
MSGFAWASSAGSSLAILVCLFYVPHLMNQVDEIRSTVAVRMDKFRVSEQGVWAKLQASRVGRARVTRQAYGNQQCQCDSFNRCPAGPPGEPGINGEHGTPRYPRTQGSSRTPWT